MKIMVTGGAGYIGSVTTEILLDHGHEVTVFDNLERGHRAAIDARAGYVHGDLRQASDIADALRTARPDAVMHFAAYALVGESMACPALYFRNNVVGGINLVSAMVSRGVRRIVFSSTCATYGQPKQIPITEATPQCPTNPYGESKLMIEKVLQWHERLNGIQSVFLRYFNACGATERFGEDHDPETHLIPNILKVALGQSKTFQIFGEDYETPDGTCIRDYIHIVDLALAHLRAMESQATGPFNLGNGAGASVREVLDVARQVTAHPIPVTVVARRPGDPDRLIADASRAGAILGWKPRYPGLRQIVQSAWNWHRTHPQGYRA